MSAIVDARRAKEEAAARDLAAAGVMIDHPGEGHPESGVFDCWSVCVGSHGGHAKTLRAAMRRCLKCCGIGSWWRTGYGEGELLSALFERVLQAHGL